MTTQDTLKLQRAVEGLENDPEYFGYTFALDIADQVTAQLHAFNKNQTWLADQLGVSRQRVSNILSGGTNFNLQTLVNLSFAFGLRPSFHLDRTRCPLSVDGETYEAAKGVAEQKVLTLANASGTAFGDDKTQQSRFSNAAE